MVDIKRANKQELIDLLMVDAMAIESMIEMRKHAQYTMGGCELSLFTHDPMREIHVQPILFVRLAELIKPDVAVVPREIRKGEYNERHFIMNLRGHDYKIFMLYTDKEAKIWNLDF